MNKNPDKKLFEIADQQQGYFTSQQAIKAGYRVNNHPYHVKNGNWIRECRGIYKLANFPNSHDDQFILWSIWSNNRKGCPQGVYSFETALSIYEASDVMPSKIHMTVPKSFRRNSEVPTVLLLHRADLQEKDYQTIRGYRVTTPLRTIIDVLSLGKLDNKLIQQAINELYKRGLLTRKDLLQLIEKEPSVAKYFINK